MAYAIQTRLNLQEYGGRGLSWTTVRASELDPRGRQGGPPLVTATQADAKAAIRDLRTLGPDWNEAEYRLVRLSSLRGPNRDPAPRRRRRRPTGYPPLPRGRRKVERVLREFQTGRLRSSSGRRVRSRRQAVAIALSEQRRAEHLATRDPARRRCRRRAAYPPYPRGHAKVERVLHEFKTGQLRTRGGRPVRSRRQAIAIALAEQRRAEHIRMRDPQRHQTPQALLRIGVVAAEKRMRGKRPNEKTFAAGRRAAFDAIIHADPQAGTSTHKYRAAQYAHGVAGLAARAETLARKLLWAPASHLPAWQSRLPKSARDPEHVFIRFDLNGTTRRIGPFARAQAERIAHELSEHPSVRAIRLTRGSSVPPARDARSRRRRHRRILLLT